MFINGGDGLWYAGFYVGGMKGKGGITYAKVWHSNQNDNKNKGGTRGVRNSVYMSVKGH